MKITEVFSGGKLCQLFGRGSSGQPSLQTFGYLETEKRVFSFRYFRLVVTGTSGANAIQFTKLKFYTTDGKTAFNYWRYPPESKATIQNHVICKPITPGNFGGQGGENGIYGLLNNPIEGKCFFQSSIYNKIDIILQFDLLEPRLDLSAFKKWSWYTANDTTSNTGRNMTIFTLEVSNNAEDENPRWYVIDRNTDPSNIKTTDNWKLAYESFLNLSEID